jgi:hypothetical protein
VPKACPTCDGARRVSRTIHRTWWQALLHYSSTAEQLCQTCVGVGIVRTPEEQQLYLKELNEQRRKERESSELLRRAEEVRAKQQAEAETKKRQERAKAETEKRQLGMALDKLICGKVPQHGRRISREEAISELFNNSLTIKSDRIIWRQCFTTRSCMDEYDGIQQWEDCFVFRETRETFVYYRTWQAGIDPLR